MADFNERFGSPSLLEQMATGFSNGAQSRWDQAKWAAGGMNGQQPPMYAGGPTYPLQMNDLLRYATKQQQSGFEAAHAALKLSPQEQALYQRHLGNLYGQGGVDNPNGSRSTLFQTTIEHDGKFYNVPTVWDGKIEANFDKNGKFQGLNDKALANIRTAGINSFPSYGSEADAEARYQQMHKYMEADTANYQSRMQPPLQSYGAQ